MKLDYNGLSELLNSFGLSFRTENGNAVFVDVETNLPMESSVVYKEGFADQKVEVTSDANKLLNGYPFYLKNESKYFKLNIGISDENINVFEITKTEIKEPHLYESCSLKKNSTFSYSVEEMTYRNHTREDGTEYASCDFISNVKFTVNDIRDTRAGGLIVKKDNKSANIWFKKNEPTGEITPDFRDEDFEEMSLQEATESIEQSKVFKSTIGILYPTLADSYANAKTSSVKPTK